MIMPILNVKDVDASVAFYHDKLGFNHDMSMKPEGQNVFSIVAWEREVVIGLGLDNGEPIGAPGVQFMLYLPEDRDIDQFYADVKARGVTIIDELKDTYWGDRAFSVKDPDGYLLTVTKFVKQVPVDEMEEHVRTQTM